MKTIYKKIRYLFFPRLAIFDRYIITQLTTFFLFSVGLFSALGVAIGTISDLTYKMTEYNLPIVIALKIFIYKIPEYIAYALPISILLTTLVIYGQLNSNSEIIALRSVGISIIRIILPTLIFSSLITCMTFFFNELVVPIFNHQTSLLEDPFISDTQHDLQTKDIFYPEYQELKSTNNSIKLNSEKTSPRQLQRIYYAEQFNSQYFIGITIINWSHNKLESIINAQSAHWNYKQQVWELFKGEIYHLSPNITDIKVENFQQKKISLPSTLFEIVNQERSPFEMNISQAQRFLAIIQHSGKEAEIREFKVRIQQKKAFPFICIIFALTGSALGAGSYQISKAQGFGICVGIVFFYYLLSFLMGALGIAGIISPILAAWLPNFLGMVTGSWLLKSTNA